MPAGIDDIIGACAEEVANMAGSVLAIAAELSKQPKPDYNKSNANTSNQSAAHTGGFIQRGKN